LTERSLMREHRCQAEYRGWQIFDIRICASKGAFVEHVSASQTVERLIQEYGKLVFHLIYSLTGDWEESQDLTQDTFLYALRAIDAARKARGEDFHAKAWLIRIAVNTARMSLRRRRLVRFSSLSQLAQGQEGENAYWQASIAPIQPAGYATQETGDPAEQVTEQDVVARSLARLPESLRLPLLLSTVAGFSMAEIAATLQLNEAAVRQRLSRARRAFQQLYASEGGESVQLVAPALPGKRQDRAIVDGRERTTLTRKSLHASAKPTLAFQGASCVQASA
jgi:RNA polymerase sigma factor (sigma-70 family)